MVKFFSKLIIAMLVIGFSVLLLGFDRWTGVEVSASQNSNSSTTPQNSNSSTTMQNSNSVAMQTVPSEQTDLSGTYAGTFTCDDVGLNGETTLTITGNQFTTSDGKSGRIVATTTRGYTAVAMQVGDVTAPAAGATVTTPMIVSLRARKSGDRLTLTSPSGSARVCSFTPTGTTARSRRTRMRQAPPAPPAATGTEVSNPVETGSPTAGPTPPPARTPRSTRGRTKTKANANANANSNAPMPENMNSNSNTGTGNANANSNASPTPSPRPPMR